MECISCEGGSMKDVYSISQLAIILTRKCCSIANKQKQAVPRWFVQPH